MYNLYTTSSNWGIPPAQLARMLWFDYGRLDDGVWYYTVSLFGYGLMLQWE